MVGLVHPSFQKYFLHFFYSENLLMNFFINNGTSIRRYSNHSKPSAKVLKYTLNNPFLKTIAFGNDKITLLLITGSIFRKKNCFYKQQRIMSTDSWRMVSDTLPFFQDIADLTRVRWKEKIAVYFLCFCLFSGFYLSAAAAWRDKFKDRNKMYRFTFVLAVHCSRKTK